MTQLLLGDCCVVGATNAQSCLTRLRVLATSACEPGIAPKYEGTFVGGGASCPLEEEEDEVCQVELAPVTV